mmetsp:Transcript_64176/g.173308  ORF Transcript_64176/g.173308 Transcript_64176/m.173308 type:complete len:509 (-) Transcript_64176:382-1908(-)
MAYSSNGVTYGQPLTAYGREFRKNPDQISKDDFEEMKDLDDDKAEKKLAEIRKGAELQDANPFMPEDRACQDCFWVLLFLLVVGATVAAGVMYFDTLVEKVQEHHAEADDHAEIADQANPKAIIGAGMLGGAGAVVFSMLFVMCAHRFPGPVVYATLFFSPCLLILSGIALILFSPESIAIGAVFLFLGVCFASCVMCCWRRYIPFMIILTECVAGVGEDHPGMIFVAIVGAIFGVVWSLTCFVSFVATHMEFEEELSDQNANVAYVLYGLCCFVCIWGHQVIDNVCHVAYCGVFGRWYFRGDTQEAVVCPSLKVALGPSLGSICLGSFLVAAVRAVEMVARQIRRSAQEEGNIILCVVMTIVTCIISCIGDILEYFNSWAYVQCAVRGTDFCTSARITYSMIKLSNLHFIITDLLLDSIQTLGALMCALFGAAVGVGAAFVMAGGNLVTLIAAGICGFFTGLMAGSVALAFLTSGVKTILMCWADAPDRLQNQEIYSEFEKRVRQID